VPPRPRVVSGARGGGGAHTEEETVGPRLSCGGGGQPGKLTQGRRPVGRVRARRKTQVTHSPYRAVERPYLKH
jgi:hypothetical protein